MGASFVLKRLMLLLTLLLALSSRFSDEGSMAHDGLCCCVVLHDWVVAGSSCMRDTWKKTFRVPSPACGCSVLAATWRRSPSHSVCCHRVVWSCSQRGRRPVSTAATDVSSVLLCVLALLLLSVLIGMLVLMKLMLMSMLPTLW